MQVTQTTSEGLKREFRVVLSANDLEEKLDYRLRELGRTVRLPGFRPGKVPPTLLRKRYGQAVLGEVVEKAVTDSAQQAMAERNLKPALQPKIEIQSFEEGKDLEYTMAVELLPDVEPVDASKIELEKRVAKVDDAEIDRALERMASQYKQTKPIEQPRPARTGDVLVIDFKGRIGGEEFPGGAAEGHHLELGSNAFIQGFEEQLVGKSVGDETTVRVTFPEAYGNAQLAGKEAEFEVKIHEIREPVQVPVGEELAKMAGMENVEALRNAVRESLQREYDAIGRTRLKRQLLDKLAAQYSFEVPAGMVDLEFEAIWRQVEEAKRQGQLEAEDAEKSEEDLKAEYRTIAERRVRLGLLLSDVGQRNDITVSREELSRALMDEARRHPGQEREVVEFYQKNPEMMANLRAPVFENKVVDFLVEMAKVSTVEVPVEDLMKEDDEAPAAEEGGKKAKKAAAKPKAARKAKGEQSE